MTRYNKPLQNLIFLLFSLFLCVQGLLAQENGQALTGVILESGSGIPVSQAIVSVASNGEFTNSDEEGIFSIILPSAIELITVSYPGYHTTDLYTTGQDKISIYLTKTEYRSNDELYSTPFGDEKMVNATNSISLVSKQVLEESASTSLNQNLSGKVAGLHIVEHSGVPGHNSWMNLRGISSIYGRNQPLVFMDGMIHEIVYDKNYIIEGHLLNPFDLVDVDDIVNVSVHKVGEGFLGSAGSNGLVNISTELNDITSATIKVKMYGGIALPYQAQEVLDAGQFRTYFSDLLEDQGYSTSAINNAYPWLNGGSGVDEYYRYNNNTDWQAEMSKPSALQKYYIFIRGGDDIATYNISSSFTQHGGAYDQWATSKYNLRLNGKVNITKKLSIIPNTKLSLTDGNLTNMGPSTQRNPVVSSLLKSPLMNAHERSEVDGSLLYPYDDTGVFGVSNPAVLIDEGIGSLRNFQLITSVNVVYTLNSKITISNLVGTSINNDRQNIFIPDIGVMQISEYAYNNPMDMVTEYRSLQNHTNIRYKNSFNQNHHIVVNGGLRILRNNYKNSLAVDLNTASDHFRSLGSGDFFSYLRTSDGDAFTLSWMSFYADANYRFNDKYFLKASLSFDGSSAFNKENRYNFYPSLSGAYRLSKSGMSLPDWVNDLKLRTTVALTGNMFSDTYLRSKTTYTGRRFEGIGVVVQDYVTNEELAAEKKLTINPGIDLSYGKAAHNLRLDYHFSMVNNLIINQALPYNYGYTEYYDNGGKLMVNGVELSGDARWHFGNSTFILDGSVTYQSTKVTDFEFVNPQTEFIVTPVEAAEYVSMLNHPINAFYGYTTDGIFQDEAEASALIGPMGRAMEAGDVRFVDLSGPEGTPDGIINDFDKQIIGNPNPDLFGGLSATFALKRFAISALLTYSVGGDIYNYVRYKTTAMDSYANQSVDVLDRWQEGSGGSDLPKAAIGDPRGNNVFSDRWIEDGSYLRLKEVKLSYTTPRIGKINKEATFYLTGTNLLTLTGYSGYDPETMYMNNPFYMGIDYGKLPLMRSIIFGIQLSL